MFCADVEVCCKEIAAYFDSEISGHPFVVNIDDYSSYQQIVSKMQADSKKTLVKVSDYCKNDELPNINELIAAATGSENKMVVGLSQYLMLQGESILKQELARIIQLPFYGRTVILLNGCGNILRMHESVDIRLKNRLVVVGANNAFKLPSIILTKSEEYHDVAVCTGIKSLLHRLETYIPNSDSENEITVITHYNAAIFNDSMFSTSFYGEVYDILVKEYREIGLSTERDWGTNEQWKDLFEQLNVYKSFSAVIDNKIGATVNLSYFIDERFENAKSLDSWYLWLAMKVMGTKENRYLSLAISKSCSVCDFVDSVYMELLSHNIDETDFDKLYLERRRLIERLPECPDALQNYCDHVGKFEKNSVYYLTDSSYKEKRLLLKTLSAYEYSEMEIMSATKITFPELHDYMIEFKFTAMNTRVPSGDPQICTELTDYFREYKLQKVRNRIFPEFLEKVHDNANSRPFNKLLPRISVVNDIDKSNAQIHFFDALGVEYLSYIIEKCDQLKLQAVVHIAHCELPSITENNLEFKKFFKSVIDENGNDILPGTKELDELKHHSKKIDYRKCLEPIHLFMELEIIDEQLRKIRDMLINDGFDKIIIISDHGASRLSVIHQHESEYLKLANHGEHSGRCCKADENPNIPEAAYENGYSVLGNYDRFKGGRAANVEVHGGATLEETVIPIIEITRIPEKSEIYFVNDYIEFHNKEIVAITVFSNIHISAPRILIGQIAETPYECQSSIDGKHYKFEIPDIKRSGTYSADLYDGEKLLLKGMTFKTKKATSTTRDFF